MTTSLTDIRAGADGTFIKAFIVTDDLGDVVDITGGTAKTQIRRSQHEPTEFDTWTEATELELHDPTNGGVRFKVPTATLQALTWESGVYALTVTVGGVAYLVAEGTIEIRPLITED